MGYASSGPLISDGQSLKIRYDSPTTWDTNVSPDITVQIGLTSGTWKLGNRKPRTTVKNFTFVDNSVKTDANGGFISGGVVDGYPTHIEKSTTYYSSIVTLAGEGSLGLDYSVPIKLSSSATDAAYRTKSSGGSWSSWRTSASTVKEGWQVQLRMKSSSNYTTTTNISITIGFDGNPSGQGEWPWNIGAGAVDDAYGNSAKTDTWSITTRQQDVVIDAFSFDDLGFNSFGTVVEAEYVTALNSYFYESISITGIDDDAIIRVRVKTGKTRYKNDSETNLSGTTYFAVAKKTGGSPPGDTDPSWTTEVTNLMLDDEVWVRLKSGNYTTQRRVTAEAYALVSDGNNTSGSVTDEWKVRTETDKYPNAFEIGPLYAVSDGDNVLLESTSEFDEAEPSFTYYGEVVFTGFGYNYDGTPVTVGTTTTGQLKVSTSSVASGSSFTAATYGNTVIIGENTRLYFKMDSSGLYSTEKKGTISVSGISDTMKIKTRPPKTKPYPFTFVDTYWPTTGGVSQRYINLYGIDQGATALAEIIDTNVANSLISSDGINWNTFAEVSNGSKLRVKIANPFALGVLNPDGTPNFTFATVRVGGTGGQNETYHVYPSDPNDVRKYYGNQAPVGADAPGIYEFTIPDFAPTVFFNMSGAGGGMGGDDAPNSYGGPGGTGMRLQGVIQNVVEGTVLQLIIAGKGSDGTDFTVGGTGGAGGSGYLTGGQGGNAGSGDKSGGGGGGGGASCIRIKSGDIIAIAGGGGGGAGAGNDTQIPLVNQYGNYNTSEVFTPGTMTTTIGNMSSGGSGSNSSGQGGGGGGGGAGQGTGGGAGSSDGDGLAGLGGGCYYNPSYFALTPVFMEAEGAPAMTDGYIAYSHGQQDVTPDPFSFDNLEDLEFNTKYESTKELITGITGNTFVLAGGGSGTEVRVFDQFGDPIPGKNWEPGFSGTTISNAQTIQVRAFSSPDPETTKEVSVTVGGTLVIWKLRTREPDDLTPFDLDIGPILNANLDTIYYSDLLTILGINVPVTASVNTGAFQACDPDNVCSVYDGNSKTVENNWTIRLKNTSANSYNTPVTMTVTVGAGAPAPFQIKTKLEPVTDPNSFIFDNIDDAVPLTEVVSTVNDSQNFYISGIGADIPIYFSEAPGDATPASELDLYLNDVLVSSYNQSAGAPTVNNADKIYIKYTTGAEAGDVANVYLVVGDYTVPAWIITNDGDPGTDPNAVEFFTVTATGPSVVTTSNVQTATGFAAATIPLYVTGGASVNIGGGWVQATASSPIDVASGDSIQLRVVSNEIPGLPTQVNVFLGAFSTTWTVITPIGAVEPKRSIWYSEFTERLGLPIGSVVAVFKDATTVDNFGFGNLDGKLNSRFHGWIECNGDTLSSNLYPMLYEAIGTTYGGSSANFALPDFRNRKVLGTGAIDGQQGGSPSVIAQYAPDGNPGGGATIAGSQGGYWYIDTIDDPAVDPPEQVADGDPPIESDFFNIGQIVTTGYENINGLIEFTVPSSATIGQPGNVTNILSLDRGVGVKLVEVPYHQHEAVHARLDPGETSGAVPWNSAGATTGTVSISYGGLLNVIPQPPDNEPVSYWGYPIGDREVTPFKTSIAPGDQINGNNEDNWDGGGMNEIDEYIDLAPDDRYVGSVSPFGTIATVKSFKSNTGQTQKHTHYLSGSVNTDDDANFTYGNSPGYGSVYGTLPPDTSEFGVPVPGAGETVEIMFTAEELGLDIFPGQFSLNTTTQIIPIPALSPQDKVPLVTPYTRAKWIIRAF